MISSDLSSLYDTESMNEQLSASSRAATNDYFDRRLVIGYWSD